MVKIGRISAASQAKEMFGARMLKESNKCFAHFETDASPIALWGKAARVFVHTILDLMFLDILSTQLFTLLCTVENKLAANNEQFLSSVQCCCCSIEPLTIGNY